MSPSKPAGSSARPFEPAARPAAPRIRRGHRDGDLELIRWSLALGVDERLAVLQDFVDTFWTPRHG
ncbi:MAG: hypothetical protein OES32_09155 [Acidobacteriota bacterium]|nr:hypothetical protein [Acidobacteriota bacterium]MDH3523740.1 hypothetical protein [Acidobacteriota bacterium]